MATTVTISDVKAAHTQIPPTVDDTFIDDFILDAEVEVRADLESCGIAVWTTEPDVIKLLIKNIAIYYELRRVYGSQVEQYHDWIAAIRTNTDKKLKRICDAATARGQLPTGLEYANKTVFKSNTTKFPKIFNLGHDLEWSPRYNRDDKRYGERTV